MKIYNNLVSLIREDKKYVKSIKLNNEEIVTSIVLRMYKQSDGKFLATLSSPSITSGYLEDIHMIHGDFESENGVYALLDVMKNINV